MNIDIKNNDFSDLNPMGTEFRKLIKREKIPLLTTTTD